jgi:hypothetical protein
MAFGLSFGSNSQKGSSTTNVNKTESVNQTESGTKASTGVTSSTGTSSSQSGSTGSTSQTGTSAQQTTGSQQTSQTTTQFSDSVLGGLESAVGQLLGAIPTAPAQMQGDFDSDAFVKSGMDAASSRITGDLEASLNSMFDQFGGRDDSNSMAMLLANRARGDAGAALSGAYANLEAQAQGIERDRFLANLQGTGQAQGFLGSVLDALKGGRASTTGSTQTSEATTGTSSQQGTSSQTGYENTQTSQQQIQALIEALNNTLAGTTNVVGTESTKTKGKTTGFGAGLSL